MLVHPNNKCTPQENLDVVYQVPCKNCKDIYRVEMKRTYGVREKQHKRDVKTLEEKYTRSRKNHSKTELHLLAITDHVAMENHTIDWECLKFPVRDTDWTARGVKEAVEIRKTGAHTMNRDGGATNFHHCTPSCW